MMVKRLVRAGSFGYQVLKAEQMPPDYARGTPQGLHLLSTLLLEVSPVVLPANADTVRKTLCDGVMCGKPLSPVLIKSLTPYSGEKKVMLAWDAKAKKPFSKEDEPWRKHEGKGPLNVPHCANCNWSGKPGESKPGVCPQCGETDTLETVTKGKSLPGTRVKTMTERDGAFWVQFADGTERGPFPSADDAMTVHRQDDASAPGEPRASAMEKALERRKGHVLRRQSEGPPSVGERIRVSSGPSTYDVVMGKIISVGSPEGEIKVQDGYGGFKKKVKYPVEYEVDMGKALPDQGTKGVTKAEDIKVGMTVKAPWRDWVVIEQIWPEKGPALMKIPFKCSGGSGRNEGFFRPGEQVETKSYATNPLEARDGYENPLSDGGVPPSKWSPGVGAKAYETDIWERELYYRPGDEAFLEKEASRLGIKIIRSGGRNRSGNGWRASSGRSSKRRCRRARPRCRCFSASWTTPTSRVHSRPCST